MSNDISRQDIPGAKSRELMARRQEYVARGQASTMSVFAAKADGAIIEDVDGNRFIDFAGGIGTMNVGHARPEVTRAIVEQAEKFTHTCSSIIMYEPYVELAERIVKLVPGDFPKKALFLNSGAEAVENAVKIARYVTGRPAIITFDNAFHGRTLLTMTMTAKVRPYKSGMYDNVRRVLVPLCVTDGQLQHGLDIIDAAFAEVAQAVAGNVS